MNHEENIVLSAIASYQTVNILELMSLSGGLSDEDVSRTVDLLQTKKLVTRSGQNTDQIVSMTSRGYDYLKSLLAVSA